MTNRGVKAWVNQTPFWNSKAAEVFTCIFVVVVAIAAFWFIWFVETQCN